MGTAKHPTADLVLRSGAAGDASRRTPQWTRRRNRNGPLDKLGQALRDACCAGSSRHEGGVQTPLLGVTPGCDWRRKALKRLESRLRMARADRRLEAAEAFCSSLNLPEGSGRFFTPAFSAPRRGRRQARARSAPASRRSRRGRRRSRGGGRAPRRAGSDRPC